VLAGKSRKTANMRLSYQGFVCPLAGEPRGSCLVSMSSKLIRSFVKPALHVGKQIGGGAGCRA
jgi:hypothetical protein